MAGPIESFVVATKNESKLDEIRLAVNDAFAVEPRPLHVPDVEETAGTLLGNARLKAMVVCSATGRISVSDDTGLEVDVLDGAPGADSGRFAGAENDGSRNAALLIKLLSNVADRDRSALFRTVAVARFPDGSEIVAEGVCEGRIIREERGRSAFGYDAIFVPNQGDGRTFAEMRRDEKNRLSHRARAFRKMADLLRAM